MNELRPGRLNTRRPENGQNTAHSALGISARRAEIDAKQEQVARMLIECEAEALVLMDPANTAWFTGTALCHGMTDPAEWPALFLTTGQRWCLASSIDSQRIFDRHLDGLGFQLKEWAWDRGRDRLLSDLRANRRVAIDRVLPDSVPLGPTLRRVRCALTEAEQSRLADLGSDVAHALEATCRNVSTGLTESEIAGHLAHRLYRRGIQPVAITVSADDRARLHLRPGAGDAAVEASCVIGVVGSQFGLHATATRTVFLQPPSDAQRREFNSATKILAAMAAAGATGTAAVTVLQAGEAIAQVTGFVDAWRTRPPGNVTGWLPVERPMPPGTPMILEPGWALVWRAAIGGTIVADTYLIDAPARCMTPCDTETWPVQHVRVQGLTLEIPDMLIAE